jgi:hypothetical protein
MIVIVASYAAGLLGTGLLVVHALHVYAWWTIRELD